jgi:ribosomal protein S18 acetylase RimI-like enzyme
MSTIIKCLAFLSLFPISVAGYDEQIDVRPAVMQELPTILALDREISYEYFKPLFLLYPDTSLGENPDQILEDELLNDQEAFLEAVEKNTDEHVFVACKEDKLVGFCYFNFHANSLVIELLCIAKEYRGTGIGKRIVNKIFESFSVDSCRLAVIEKNEAACKFWQSMGFSKLNEKPIDMGNDFPSDCAHVYHYYQYKKDR